MKRIIALSCLLSLGLIARENRYNDIEIQAALTRANEQFPECIRARGENNRSECEQIHHDLVASILDTSARRNRFSYGYLERFRAEDTAARRQIEKRNQEERDALYARYLQQQEIDNCLESRNRNQEDTAARRQIAQRNQEEWDAQYARELQQQEIDNAIGQDKEVVVIKKHHYSLMSLMYWIVGADR